MKRYKYIDKTRPRLPLLTTAIVFLIIKVYEPSDMLSGIMYTILSIIWLVLIVTKVNSESISLDDIQLKEKHPFNKETHPNGHKAYNETIGKFKEALKKAEEQSKSR